MGYRLCFIQTGDFMINANNCFWVMIGLVGNEKTTKTQATLANALVIGFTFLFRSFIARICLYESCVDIKNTIAGSKYHPAWLLTALRMDLQ
ncbi:MAG: hypothetical protein EOO42_01660 [Flavobacteriales bacterium]|nr:MAG: hypothetical protein EOO42_01660 [Flavobacteriales bacterium]